MLEIHEHISQNLTFIPAVDPSREQIFDGCCHLVVADLQAKSVETIDQFNVLSFLCWSLWSWLGLTVLGPVSGAVEQHWLAIDPTIPLANVQTDLL